MKNLKYFLLLLINIVFAQNTIPIDFQTMYKMEYEDVEQFDIKVESSSSLNSSLITYFYRNKKISAFIQNGRIYFVNQDLEHNLKIVKHSEDYEPEDIGKSINVSIDSLQRIDKQNKIAGIECNYYQFNLIYEDLMYDFTFSEKFEVCLAENNKINNFNNLGKGSEKLNGLILEFGKADSKNRIKYYSSKPFKSYVKFNLENERQHLALIEEIKKKRKEEDVPEAIEEVMDSISSDYYNNYNSTYKNEKTKEPLNLAITLFGENDSVFKALPKFCKDLNVPDINDKNINLHLKNLSGQICDLYLYKESDGANVSLGGTIDEIRREYLYIFNNFNKLTKKDQKQVLEFINALD